MQDTASTIICTPFAVSQQIAKQFQDLEYTLNILVSTLAWLSGSLREVLKQNFMLYALHDATKV